jgi:TRAP-type C4-dicarboxylate transport system permease small subunit
MKVLLKTQDKGRVPLKRFMFGLDRFMNVADRMIEWVGGVFMMGLMVIIVFYQVFARYLFHHVPAWSEEVSLLLMMWFGFLTIGYGFRHQLHLRVSMVMDLFPKRVGAYADIVADILIAAFGLFLIVEGYKFTVLTWSSTLPVTKLPSGVQYLIIPITGVMTMLYGLVLLVNRGRRKA